MLMYECDGCGKVEKSIRADDPTNKIRSVWICVTSNKGQGEHEFHLCAGCESHLRQVADPKTWTRALNEVN